MTAPTNFATAFKHEVTRLVRRELRKELTPVLTTMRRQRERIKTLQQALTAAQQAAAKPGVTPTVDDTMLRKARFSGGLIKKLRLRHKLPRSKFARLLGVSALSVKAWEDNKGRPKAENQKRLLVLRQLSTRTLKKLLAEKKTVA
jgi:DNA-binding transcriptional regulator YiaG